MENLFKFGGDMLKKGLREFDKTENMVREDVALIKEWLKTQPHLPELTRDKYIQNFLFLNKFSIEKTKQRIDMYYTVRSLIPDLFDECNPSNSKMQNALRRWSFVLHPKPVEGLYRVFFFRSKEPNVFLANEFTMQTLNIAELRIMKDVVFGEVMIYDMTNITVNDLRKFTPSILKKVFVVYEKVYALRLQACYFINSPTYVSMLTSILKAILKPKIFDRIHVHKDAEILKTLFSKEDLPRDYGGEGMSLDELQEIMNREFEQHKDRFDQLDKLRVDESLRPEKLDNDEVLGYYGNFRQLAVD